MADRRTILERTKRHHGARRASQVAFSGCLRVVTDRTLAQLIEGYSCGYCADNVMGLRVEGYLSQKWGTHA